MMVQERSWLSRNWKWLTLISVIVIGLAIAAFVILRARSLRSSPGYEQAMSIAQKHPVLTAELGTPIEPGWFVRGRTFIKKEGIEGVLLTIPIHGPKNTGTLRAEVWKSNLMVRGVQQWDVVFLEADVEGRSDPIDLVGASRPPDND